MSVVFPRLYAIIDASLLTTSELILAETLAESGVELIQYRNKTAASRQFFKSPVNFRVRSRRAAFDSLSMTALTSPWLANAAAYTWAGRSGGGRSARICGSGRWVGVSTHTLEQVKAADQTSADYIAFGPIFPTRTKENPDAVVAQNSCDRHARSHEASRGHRRITLDRAAEVYRAGADSLAVIRDLFALQARATARANSSK